MDGSQGRIQRSLNTIAMRMRHAFLLPFTRTDLKNGGCNYLPNASVRIVLTEPVVCFVTVLLSGGRRDFIVFAKNKTRYKESVG